MLSIETKRKIDNARDVLVGKIPNPQAQIEQITTALIYKFMDDMDEKSKTLGGKARFFVGEFEKYSWRTLIDPRIGGQERMNLYSEAVQRLSQNANLPQIFRDVFKDAFVPYRDPETLSLFLKEINWFDYHHSEELGNAYEYLLSIMSSQGDAGQFRTPRHIIDFIVAAVDPQKDESILDPACGTAGFLISAYKHIIGANDGLDDITGLPTDQEERLKPEERAKLLKNFHGYDIDPGMVRLSLVNMYLHGFVMPNIEEYDSLTYEDRWNDDFDVILANPPFMTPKGGVRPHKRFQIQANRAEVLFVDYIAEHLRPQGRAGIVVPEGIIFQSGTAYKALRKMLVEEQGLWAVASLPAGVFRPYSGVKTTILLLDKSRAKQTDEILFIDINHDGYSLGAQRTATKKNDFPEALNVLNTWKLGVKVESTIAQWVSKDAIRSTADYILSGQRHKKSDVAVSDWNTIALGDVARIDNGNAFKSSEYVDTGARVIRITNVQKGEIVDDSPKFLSIQRLAEFEKYNLFDGDLLMSLTGNVGRVGVIGNDLLPALLNQRVARIVPNEGELNKRYLFHILNSDWFESQAIENSSGVAQKNLSTEWLKRFKIPLPPLSMQKEIVSELDSYEKIIRGARQVIDNWEPSVAINPNWEKVRLGEVFKTSSGGTPLKSKTEFYNGTIPWLGSGEVSQGHISSAKNYITEAGLKGSSAKIFPPNTVLIAMYGATVGRVGILDIESSTNQAVCGIFPNPQKALPEFIYLLMTGFRERLIALSVGGAQPNISQSIIRELEIHLPPLEVQEAIVKELLIEQAAIKSNEQLIANYRKKIEAKIAEVWGE